MFTSLTVFLYCLSKLTWKNKWLNWVELIHRKLLHHAKYILDFIFDPGSKENVKIAQGFTLRVIRAYHLIACFWSCLVKWWGYRVLWYSAWDSFRIWAGHWYGRSGAFLSGRRRSTKSGVTWHACKAAFVTPGEFGQCEIQQKILHKTPLSIMTLARQGGNKHHTPLFIT